MKRILFATIGLALGLGLSVAGAEPQTRSPGTGVQLAQSSARQACVSRCQSSRDQCMNAISVVTGPQGQRYKPADEVHACGQTYGNCLSGCPR